MSNGDWVVSEPVLSRSDKQYKSGVGAYRKINLLAN